MRWKTKQDPKLGDTRWVKKFAWFPVETDSGDSLWMESYYVKERISTRTSLGVEGSACEYLGWVIQQTVTPEEYEAVQEDIRWNIAITEAPKLEAGSAFASLVRYKNSKEKK